MLKCSSASSWKASAIAAVSSMSPLETSNDHRLRTVGSISDNRTFTPLSRSESGTNGEAMKAMTSGSAITSAAFAISSRHRFSSPRSTAMANAACAYRLLDARAMSVS